jgi:cytidine deaminase
MSMLTTEMRLELVRRAHQARELAYAPYSGYRVGAALLAMDGSIYLGVNVENAAYPTSMCAERTAVYTAVAAGKRQFSAIAVVTSNGGFPCGACRQVLAEFGTEMIVLIADQQGKLVAEKTLRDLLPGAFLPKDLER